MKHPQIKLYSRTIRQSQVIRSKKVKIYHLVEIYRLIKLFLQPGRNDWGARGYNSIMHTVFQLYDVLRFNSTVVVNVLINIPSPKLNNQIFLTSKHRVHEYASGLTSILMAELFCSCKRRNLIGQNTVKSKF